MAESELVILRSLTPGQPSDRSITNITVQTCISRKIVSSEALSTSVCVTTLRASGWARGADSTARALSIGTRLTLSIIICCCAYAFTRLPVRFIAPAVEEEVSICALSTHSSCYSIAEGCPCIGSAVAVQRGLAGVTAPRAVFRSSDGRPAGLTATRVSLALVHAGSIGWATLTGVLESLPRGAAQALVGPRCAARGAARVAGEALRAASVRAGRAHSRAGQFGGR